MSKQHRDKVRLAKEREKNLKKVWNGEVALYVLGGIFCLMGMFSSAFSISEDESILLHLPLVSGLALIGFGIWAKKQKYNGLLAGTILSGIILIFMLLGGLANFLLIIIVGSCFAIILTGTIYALKMKKPVTNNEDLLDL